MKTRRTLPAFASLALTLIAACSSTERLPTAATPVANSATSTSPETSPPAAPPPATSGRTASVLAVGDIGMCSERDAVRRTGDLVARLDGQLLLAGDLAYMNGSLHEFNECFDGAWGRFRGRWHPVPGNHEYGTPDAAGYRQYFGSAAAPAGRLYYATRIGEWLVLMLDSNDYVRPGSAQYEFVRHELTTARAACTVAVWHHPLFSSGPNGANPFMRDLWSLLYEHGVDVAITAHDHLYERFDRLDADGRVSARGMRQFIAGTGGARLYQPARYVPGSQIIVSALGVLQMTLRPDGYDWAFIDTNGATLDAGSDRCH
jgi:acid phosphatase type 7